jgi:endonuclease III
MNREQIRAVFERLQAANPTPTTELRYRTPFELLVAVILSAQSTDLAVNKVTERLFRVANTPEAIAGLGEEALKAHIRTLGLYNSKARHILQASREIVEKHGGQVPSQREALEALPGVGRKTANVVLNTVFGESAIAVDTHIFRVGNRTGLARGKTPITVERALVRRVPAEFRRHAHHWLILHGRYVCTARKPHCWECPIEDLCEYRAKNLVPQPARPTPAVGRAEASVRAEEPAAGRRRTGRYSVN